MTAKQTEVREVETGEIICTECGEENPLIIYTNDFNDEVLCEECMKQQHPDTERIQ